jgi:hypothetical protein
MMLPITINYGVASFWVSMASFLISVAATWIAKSSLKRAEVSIRQAEQVAARDQRDWKQRKWFDLYLKANELYDALEFFQTKYVNIFAQSWVSGEWKSDFNDLTHLIRAAHAMAMVFPVNAAVTEFCESTTVFSNPQEALSKERLKKVFNAVEKIRERARINDPSILE